MGKIKRMAEDAGYFEMSDEDKAQFAKDFHDGYYNFKVDYCPRCIQMTNHLDNKCQKCENEIGKKHTS